jgi:hypothetical protein
MPAAPARTCTTKTTIVVVGLLHAQARQLEGRCGSSAKLRFVEARGNIPNLPTGDYIVLLVKHVRHCGRPRHSVGGHETASTTTAVA